MRAPSEDIHRSLVVRTGLPRQNAQPASGTPFTRLPSSRSRSGDRAKQRPFLAREVGPQPSKTATPAGNSLCVFDSQGHTALHPLQRGRHAN